jgi:hypothetical protein
MEEQDSSDAYTMNRDSHFTTSLRDDASPRPPSRSPGRAYSRETRSLTPYPRHAGSPTMHPQSPRRRSPAQSGAPHRSTSYRRTSRTSPYPQAPTSPMQRSSISIATSSYLTYDSAPVINRSLLADPFYRQPSPSPPPPPPSPPSQTWSWLEPPKLRATRVRQPLSFKYTTAFVAEDPAPRSSHFEMPGVFPKTPELATSDQSTSDDAFDPPQPQAQAPRLVPRLVSARVVTARELEAAYQKVLPLTDHVPGAVVDGRSVPALAREVTYQQQEQNEQTTNTNRVPNSSDPASSSTLADEATYKYSTKKTYAQLEQDASTQPLPQWEPHHLTRSPNGGGAVAERRVVYERMVELARREEEKRARRG